MQTIRLVVNGEARTIITDPERSLLDVLRENLALTGAKKGCDKGLCGACAVLVDGKVRMSCRLPVKLAEGKTIITIEGIGTEDSPHPIQTAFALAGAVQCGYCTPGMVIRAKSLLDKNLYPSREELVQAFQPQLCRCTGYTKIFDAVNLAALVLRGESVFPSTRPKPGIPLVGCRIPRKDALAKATGTEKYAADLKLADLLYLSVMRSPYPHALIKSIQVEHALAQPGVASVFTAADISGSNRLKISRADTPILCDDKVRCVGDPVAVVAADTAEAAAAALKHIEVEYEHLKAVFDPEEALREGALQIHPDSPNLLAKLQLKSDDAAASLEKCGVVVQGVLGLAALKLRRPVKLVYSREETHAVTTKRHPFKLRCKLGSDRSGLLTALEMDIVSNSGAYASFGKSVMTRALAHATGPYRIPNVRVTGQVVFTNGPVSGAMRGFGVPQVLFALESLLDMLAAKLDMDPLEIRRMNALCKGDTTATGQLLDHEIGLHACLERLQPYYNRAKSLLPREEGTAKHGVGLACMWFGPGKSRPDESEAQLELTPAGTVRLFIGASDMGQGSDTVFAQLVAQELGLPFSAVEVVTTDTLLTPDGGYSSGSRQTYISGGAVQAAAAKLRLALLETAGRIMAQDPAGLKCDSGLIYPTNAGEQKVSFQELADSGLAAQCFVGRRVAEISNMNPETGAGNPYETYSFGVQMAEVEVNTASGETKVKRITAVHDSGVAINPMSLEGQIEGGAVMGLGYALTEEFVPRQSSNFAQYRLPRAKDTPEIVSILIEIPRPGGPYGAGAAGECALVPTAPAITNAIAQACGVRVFDLPATKERLKTKLS